MALRIAVSHSCSRRCPSCFACRSEPDFATLQDVLAATPEAGQPLVLGGGDATKWPYLKAFLTANAQRPEPVPVWLEAPAAAFTPAMLPELRRWGVTGLRVQIEAVGEKMIAALRVGDGEAVIARAEELGLSTDARLCVRPRTFGIVAPLARRLDPHRVWVEILRQDWGKPATTLPARDIDAALVRAGNVRFSAHRAIGQGYLPPCVMPETWRLNPALWQSAFGKGTSPNDALPACGACALNRSCQWNDPGALDASTLKALKPISHEAPDEKPAETTVPELLLRTRPGPAVICTEPWTTIEIPAHEGLVFQCGADWTVEPLGNIHTQTLYEIWNGPGFQKARRLMGQSSLRELCLPVCTRLYDGALHERKFRVRDGSPAFVRNQLLLAEELAERKEILTALPLHLTLFPSSYCNYNCVFCEYGRRDRIDMPERVWDELPTFLPALKTLTLLGGEPLANPRVWDLLTSFDEASWPDVRIDIFTNGALMTEKALRRVKGGCLGEITISLNAGTAEVYDAVERGSATLATVVANLDALIRFRETYGRWFGITISMIVMRESAHTLIPFGQLALERNLHVRLVALNVKNFPELDFYTQPEEVQRVVAHVDEFIAWARRVGRDDYVRQAMNAREAVRGEAARAADPNPGSLVRLGRRPMDPPPAIASSLPNRMVLNDPGRA